MKIIILAGGGGTRLFPLSRTTYPKQFLQIGNEQSLLAQTVKRFTTITSAKDIVVVTNKAHLHHVQAELESIGAKDANILCEPLARNTAPAIALAVRYCIDKLGSTREDIFFISPADHII